MYGRSLTSVAVPVSPHAIAERSLQSLELVVRRWKHVGLPAEITLLEAQQQVEAHHVEMDALDCGVLGQIELAWWYGILDERQTTRAKSVLGEYALLGQYYPGIDEARRIQAVLA